MGCVGAAATPSPAPDVEEGQRIMTTVTGIVVGTDFSHGSNQALKRAVQLATQGGWPLHLLHAFDVGAWHRLRAVFDVQRLGSDPPPDVRTRQRLDETATALATQTGLRVVSHFGLGAAHTVIEAHVAAHPGTLVVVGSRAEPELPGLGSTAARLLHSPAGPVLVVRTAASQPCQCVMAAVDLSEASLRAAALGVALFPAAHHHLYFAIDPALDQALWGGKLAKAQLELLRGSVHESATAQLQQLARTLTPQARRPVSFEIADDVPARAIVARALALGADCVVTGHHGQGDAPQRWLGHMAQHVLQHTARDVLVVP